MSSPGGLRQRALELREAQGPGRRPPTDQGERLATIQRPDGSELRLSWREFEGKFFLAAQRWKPGEGGFWPDKEQRITVRLREIADFADGIAKALDKAHALTVGRS